MASQYPLIGSWYQDIAESQFFEVVAIDEQANTIEIQYLDGSIDEFEMDGWEQLPLISAEPPEDPGPAYGLSVEDLSSEDDSHLYGSVNPLEMLEPDRFQDFDDYYPWL